MYIVDRYIAWLFLRVIVICFVSLLGLYVVFDFMGNFEEFINYGKVTPGGVPAVLLDYYGPRAFQLFDRTAGLLAMVAAMFAVTWLQRTQEFTALMAAGISQTRIIATVIIGALLIAGLGIANRELALPRVREKLTRNAQDWLGQGAQAAKPCYDARSNILISGRNTFANQQRIESPKFVLPPELGSWGKQLLAENAFYQPAKEGRPAGYLLKNVSQPADLANLPSSRLEGQLVLLSPSDTAGLEARELFVVSGISFEQLTVGSDWQQYLSSYELVTGLRNLSLDYGASVRVAMHARLVQPLLDLTLLFLGLPLVLTRGNRNLFVAGGMCLGIMLAFFVVQITCHSLGSNYLLNTRLAAWLPLIIFAPIAFALSRPLWTAGMDGPKVIRENFQVQGA